MEPIKNQNPDAEQAAAFAWPKLATSLFLLAGFVLSLLAVGGYLSFLNDASALQTCSTDGCKGAVTVYRFSFTLFLFYLFMAVFQAPSWSPRFRAEAHTGYWFSKIVFFGGLLVFPFFMPNSFFVYYAYFSLVLGGIFVLLQCLIIIEFSYAWNESWVSKEEQKYLTGILAACFVFFAAGLALTGLMYHWFTENGSCDLNKFFISMTLVLGVIFTALSLVVRHGALLPSAVIFGISCYWTWSSVQSEPAEYSCNSLSSSTNANRTQVALGATFAALSLVYTTLSTSASAKNALSFERPGLKNDGDDKERSGKLWHFYVIMILGSCYMSAVVTGWSLSSTSSVSSLDSGWASSWIKIVAVWLTCLLYLWSLIAPSVCKNRDFGLDV